MFDKASFQKLASRAASPNANAHKFGLYETVWVVARELEAYNEFECEVCVKGKLELRTKDRSGNVVAKAVDCWYCKGTGKRQETDWLWKATGPGIVRGYSADVFLDGKGGFYEYVKYHVVLDVVSNEDGKEGELVRLNPREMEIFPTESLAEQAADRLNALIREGKDPWTGK